jgi:Flp pilus assembly CpaF family ATPase
MSTRLSQRAEQPGPALTPAERVELVEQLLPEAAKAAIGSLLSKGQAPMSPAIEDAAQRAVRDRLLGLGGFEELMRDPSVENINANGYDNVWTRCSGNRRNSVGPVAESNDDMIAMVRRAATQAGRDGGEERRWDSASPELSLQLPGGQRLHALMSVSRVPTVAIRCYRILNADLNQLCAMKMMDPGIREFLRAAVRAGINIIVSGGLGLGKTTLARALAGEIPSDQYLVTVEDVFELNLDLDSRHPKSSALQAREDNIEGRGAFTMDHLIRSALRMSADRVLVGEARGAEVIPMLHAMCQGADGSIGTIHSSASDDVPDRIISYAQSKEPPHPESGIVGLLKAAAPMIVHLDYSDDKTPQRVVSSIREITGRADSGIGISTIEIFAPGHDNRAAPAYPPRQKTLRKLINAGFNPRLLQVGPAGGYR